MKWSSTFSSSLATVILCNVSYEAFYYAVRQVSAPNWHIVQSVILLRLCDKFIE
jgi:hypothetical protein